MMLEARGIVMKGMPPTNRRLLDVELIGSTVFALETAMKALKVDAVPMSALETAQHCEATTGQLISFKGRFRSAHAPRVKADGIPEGHPTGDLDRDHVIRKSFAGVELVLPLDSFRYASNSSVSFFRSMDLISVHGLAKVHSVEGTRIVASPLWMTLPYGPFYA